MLPMVLADEAKSVKDTVCKVTHKLASYAYKRVIFVQPLHLPIRQDRLVLFQLEKTQQRMHTTVPFLFQRKSTLRWKHKRVYRTVQYAVDCCEEKLLGCKTKDQHEERCLVTSDEK